MAQPARASVMFMTAEEFLEHPLDDVKAELVRGELRLTPPPGGPHGVAASNLHYLLSAHARAHGLGRAFVDGIGYELVRLPHTVRVPDCSFVRAERLPAEGIAAGLLKLAPDLAVEVLSPSERASELEETLDDYAIAGTPLAWVIDPARRAVVVYETGQPRRRLHEGDTLAGGDVIPGISCRVADIFEGIARLG